MKKFIKVLGIIILTVLFLALLYGWNSFLSNGEIESRLEHSPPLVFTLPNTPPIIIYRDSDLKAEDNDHILNYNFQKDFSKTPSTPLIGRIHVTASLVDQCTWQFPGSWCASSLFNPKSKAEQDHIILGLAQNAVSYLNKEYSDNTFNNTSSVKQKDLNFKVLNQGPQHYSVVPPQPNLTYGTTQASIIIIIPQTLQLEKQNLGLAYTITVSSTSPSPEDRMQLLNDLISSAESVQYAEIRGMDNQRVFTFKTLA